MLKLGSTDINKSYLGATEINKIYLGVDEVFSDMSFSPADIPDLALWLDASDTATITQTAGAVSAWADKSEEGNNATQGSGAAQPITGAETINSKNALKFSTDDSLILPNAVRDIINAGPCTVFVVALPQESKENILINANTGGSRTCGIVLAANNNVLFQSSGTIQNTSGSTYSEAPMVAIGMNDGALVYAYKNNEDGVSSAVSAVPAPDRPLLIGDQEFNAADLDGLIGEIIIYNSALTDELRLQVYSYLASKWGVVA